MDTFEKSALLSILLGEICLVVILLFGFDSHRRKIEELKEQLKATRIEKAVECNCSKKVVECNCSKKVVECNCSKKVVECNCNKEIKDGEL